MKKNMRFLSLSLIVILIDQITKTWAMHTLMPYQAQKIFPFFNLTLAYNTGAAFSFLNTASGWQNIFFIAIALVISVVLIVWLSRVKNNVYEVLGISFILGGAVGNLIDRIHYGFVVDFLEFHVYQHAWPIFNIADSAICIGVALILIGTMVASRKTQHII